MFGSHEECLQVLTTEMVSDQEDEYDIEGKQFRARGIPHYRKQRVSNRGNRYTDKKKVKYSQTSLYSVQSSLISLMSFVLLTTADSTKALNQPDRALE